MFILIYFLVVSLSQAILNLTTQANSNSPEAYEFGKKDSIILGVVFILGIILQILQSFFDDIFWYVCAGYFFISIIVVLITLQSRKEQILKRKKDMLTVYEILKPIIDKKEQGFDPTNPGFAISYKGNKIKSIEIPLNPASAGNSKSEEAMITNCISVFNKFLNYFRWQCESDYTDRVYRFIGKKLPPDKANYMGSWLRPAQIVPLGLANSEQEVAWIIDDRNKSNVGESCYEDNGQKPSLYELQTAPHSLIWEVKNPVHNESCECFVLKALKP
jgi:hypothetical protein